LAATSTLSLHSSNEPGELSQWLCYDDTTINIISGSCPRLIVPLTWLSTIGDRSFRVTVAQAWNSLPTNVTASTSLPPFKRQLKTFLFTKSFPSL